MKREHVQMWSCEERALQLSGMCTWPVFGVQPGYNANRETPLCSLSHRPFYTLNIAEGNEAHCRNSSQEKRNSTSIGSHKPPSQLCSFHLHCRFYPLWHALQQLSVAPDTHAVITGYRCSGLRQSKRTVF